MFDSMIAGNEKVMCYGRNVRLLIVFLTYLFSLVVMWFAPSQQQQQQWDVAVIRMSLHIMMTGRRHSRNGSHMQ